MMLRRVLCWSLVALDVWVSAASNEMTKAEADRACAEYLSTADISASISAVEDKETCMKDKDAVGCFAQICRFCKASNKDTEHNRHFGLCKKMFNYEDAPAGSPFVCSIDDADKEAGVFAFHDTTCQQDDQGCRSGSCRLCRTSDASEIMHLRVCPADKIATDLSCKQIAKNSSIPGVSYVIQPECNTTNPSLQGCVANTTCRLCRQTKKMKMEENQYLDSCAVLQVSNVIGVSLQDVVGQPSNDDSSSKVSTTIAVIALAATVAIVVGAIVVIRRLQRQDEEVIGTPREGLSTVLVTGHGHANVAEL